MSLLHTIVTHDASGNAIRAVRHYCALPVEFGVASGSPSSPADASSDWLDQVPTGHRTLDRMMAVVQMPAQQMCRGVVLDLCFELCHRQGTEISRELHVCKPHVALTRQRIPRSSGHRASCGLHAAARPLGLSDQAEHGTITTKSINVAS